MSVNNITNMKIGFQDIINDIELDINNIKYLYIVSDRANFRLPNINDVYYEGLIFEIYNNTNFDYSLIRYNVGDTINGINNDYLVMNTVKKIKIFLYKVNNNYNQWFVL